jgi:uncharacterized protein YeaO (DUF488 family)
MNKLILSFILIPTLACSSEGEKVGQGHKMLTRLHVRQQKEGEIGESAKMLRLKIKRIYQDPDKNDGTRILIDGLWPRGIKKTDAKIDLWLKDIAPSADLRKWFNHEPEKWAEFRERFYQELNLKQEAVQILLDILKKPHNVTLLYGSKEERYNNAVALKEYLEHHLHQ